MLIASPVHGTGMGKAFPTAASAAAAAEALQIFLVRIRFLETQFGFDAQIEIPELGIHNTGDGATVTMFTAADAAAFSEAVGSVRASIGGRGVGFSFETTNSLSELVINIEDLLSLWRAAVGAEGPPAVVIKKRVSGLAIAGGLFVGIAALSAILYAKTREEAGR